MAETTEQKDPAASGQGKAPAPRAEGQEEEPTFHVDRLLSDEAYALTGQPAHIVAGALELVRGNKKNFTREEARDLVTEFLEREVPAEGEEQ